MGITEDSVEQRERLLKLWQEYGSDYNVFVPEEQPDPREWNRKLILPDAKAKLDPQAIKHWRYFEKTRDFLRKRYSEYAILVGPALVFDCLVPKFQKPLKVSAEKRRRYKFPHDGEPSEWYERVLQMTITSVGEIGIVCNSQDCQRSKCKLNVNNPKRISPCDIFSLIQIFHGYHSVASTIAIVEKEFGKLGKFKSSGIEEKPKIIRYAVPKHEVYELISRYSNMKRQHVSQLVADITALIMSCHTVELDHNRVFSNYFAFFQPSIIDRNILSRINSPAIKLYLWLLIKQEELARKNQWGLDITDTEVARHLSLSRKTIVKLKGELQKLGFLTIKHKKWIVGYG